MTEAKFKVGDIVKVVSPGWPPDKDTGKPVPFSKRLWVITGIPGEKWLEADTLDDQARSGFLFFDEVALASEEEVAKWTTS